MTELFGEKNLLSIHIEDADRASKPIGETDNSATAENCDVQVAFRNIEAVAVETIKQYPVIYGCMAWLTNHRILRTLASRDDTAIILQKEDFLRPDVGGPSKNVLRDLYAALPSKRGEDSEGQYQFGYNFCSMIEGLEAVRCVGYGPDKGRTIPRMHNKFLVLCDYVAEPLDPKLYGVSEFKRAVPRAVLTGSFNMTENANKSLENIVVIKNEEIAKAYYREFVTIFGISEPLDWRHEYVSPLYSNDYPFGPRFGT